MTSQVNKKKKSESVASATLRHVRIPPQKVRLVLDLVKGKQLEPALNAVQFHPTKGGRIVYKLLRSAMANAQEKGDVDVDQLWVTGGHVDMGKTLRRFLPRAQGRATPIRKRSSHITVQLGRYL
ncbi:50S ribosomal protein L22 [bacterium]|nr:50S ribosomal protein L22 [bacterium]